MHLPDAVAGDTQPQSTALNGPFTLVTPLVKRLEYHENSTLKAPFCISGHGMPGATAADEFDKTLAFLEAIVNADDETTVGEIRPFADDLDAVRFNRHKINRQLSRLDLASPVLEPEVIWLGRRR